MADEPAIWLQIATFADGAHQEGDLLYAGSIVGRVEVVAETESAPAAMPTFDHDVLFVLMLAAEYPSRRVATVATEFLRPNGESAGRREIRIHFADRIRASAIIRARLRLAAEGTYWMNVSIDDTLVTRVPLEVAYRASEGSRSEPSALTTSGRGEPQSPTTVRARSRRRRAE